MRRCVPHRRSWQRVTGSRRGSWFCSWSWWKVSTQSLWRTWRLVGWLVGWLPRWVAELGTTSQHTMSVCSKRNTNGGCTCFFLVAIHQPVEAQCWGGGRRLASPVSVGLCACLIASGRVCATREEVKGRQPHGGRLFALADVGVAVLRRSPAGSTVRAPPQRTHARPARVHLFVCGCSSFAFVEPLPWLPHQRTNERTNQPTRPPSIDRCIHPRPPSNCKMYGHAGNDIHTFSPTGTAT